MTERYRKTFVEAATGPGYRSNGVFMPFTVLGWPDKYRCLESVKTMISSGAHALELGIAFSDPIADGPVIQNAYSETIRAGFTTDDAFELVSEIRSHSRDIPIGLLVYFNSVRSRGIDSFYMSAARAGVDGVLVVDLPPEHALEASLAARKNNIAQIFIVSPLTTAARLDLILEQASGFLYCVSRLGVTGVEESYDRDLKATLQLIHKNSDLPAVVGFGVSSPAQARRMVELGADGVVTGSAVLEVIRNARGDSGRLRAYIESMVRSVDRDMESGRIRSMNETMLPSRA